jgi:hypothetical protein
VRNGRPILFELDADLCRSVFVICPAGPWWEMLEEK